MWTSNTQAFLKNPLERNTPTWSIIDRTHLKNNPSPCDLGEAKYSRNKVFHKIFLDTPLTQLGITWLRQKYNTACQRLHQIALPTAEHT